MYKILSLLPPAVLPSRTPLARYVKANIFDKLGLNSTTYSYAVAKDGLADGTAREIGANSTFIPHAIPYWIPESGEDGNNESGDGAIVSNAVDLVSLFRALFDPH
jgi:CubicO group peptidase (beta-lactamase class C family)